MGKKATWINIIAMIGAITAKAAPILALTPAAPVVTAILIGTNIVAQLTPAIQSDIVKVKEPEVAAHRQTIEEIPVENIKK